MCRYLKLHLLQVNSEPFKGAAEHIHATALDLCSTLVSCRLCTRKKMNKMFSSLVFALFTAFVLADASQYSYSPFRGSAYGKEITLRGRDRITGVRMWSGNNNFVFGIQLRFGHDWSKVAGCKHGALQEILLFEDETIVQVSGKYGRFIQQLVFVTSRGRFLMAGQPSFQSFNMFPEHKDAELLFFSLRYQRALTAVAAHWAVIDPNL